LELCNCVRNRQLLVENVSAADIDESRPSPFFLISFSFFSVPFYLLPIRRKVALLSQASSIYSAPHKNLRLFPCIGTIGSKSSHFCCCPEVSFYNKSSPLGINFVLLGDLGPWGLTLSPRDEHSPLRLPLGVNTF
jgi:hypothetical protein